MKQLLILLSMSLLPFLSKSQNQNGGQFYENNAVRLIYLGYTNGTHTFKIVNKQGCQVTIRTRVEQEPAEDTQIPANDSFITSVPRATPENLKYRIKAETACSQNIDMGWLELNTAFIAMPLVENNSVVIVRGSSEFRASVSHGVYASSYANRDYFEHITIYNIAGLVKYKATTFVRKRNTINLDDYLQTGVNFIDILIETNKPEHITIKYIK